ETVYRVGRDRLTAGPRDPTRIGARNRLERMADALEDERAGELVRDRRANDVARRAQTRIGRRAVAARHLRRVVREIGREPADVFAKDQEPLRAVRST